MIRSSVDLPEPLGPSSAVSEPSGISSETSSSATKSPNDLRDVANGDHASSLRGLIAVIASSVASAMNGEQRGRGVRAGEVEVLEALLDEQRERLGLARDLARDDGHRAELADAAGDREHDAVGDAPADRRQRDAPERLPAAGAERRRGLLLLVADLLQHGRDLAHDERHRDEDRRQHDARDREDHLERQVAEPAAAPEHEDQREADDDRRDRERQVDDRVEQRLAAEAAARERERAEHAEDRVERHRDRGDRDRQPERRDRRRAS